ncbi:hypothetical protein PVAP13_1KG336105 [Panicum virgatum]|uniref:Uncharacterized protein n=1 Tax=Panicum virgatum TaxID=38727 RepID=A0A8T0XI49_PANVG|nr:hypothetical protein PVAP13_1KG336105 [Panicum virgatum]
MDTGEWQAATFYSPVAMPWVSLGGSPTSPAALRVERPPAQQRYRLGVRARRGRAGKEDTGAAASWLVGGLGVARTASCSQVSSPGDGPDARGVVGQWWGRVNGSKLPTCGSLLRVCITRDDCSLPLIAAFISFYLLLQVNNKKVNCFFFFDEPFRLHREL